MKYVSRIHVLRGLNLFSFVRVLVVRCILECE